MVKYSIKKFSSPQDNNLSNTFAHSQFSSDHNLEIMINCDVSYLYILIKRVMAYLKC